MCGFCGLIGPVGDAGLEDLEAMGHALDHRGPDDFGVWRDRFDGSAGPLDIGLAQTRLAILDLSPAGHQPMESENGALVVVYNGEIYNFRALRDELRRSGLTFRSDCDTEVLLRAFEAWGEDAFDRFQGMFAFALFDRRRGRLFLVRDRLGIKPLFWRLDAGRLTFGSELGALRRHRHFSPEIDPVALGLYLRHGYVAGPTTIYRKTSRLAPGEYLVWEGGRVETRRFWSLADPVEAPPPASFDETVDVLESLLGDAVEQRLVSDVPLGAFLSGGVDSSTVVALMRQRATGAVRSFAIGFEDARWNEAPFALDVARHLKTDHTELYVSARDAVDVAEEMPDLYDEPFADPSAIPTVLLSRLTREHVTVALSGDGGDELFGGYWQYEKLKRLLPGLRVPHPLRRAAAAGSVLLPQGALRNGLRHLRARTVAELAYGLVTAFDDALLEAACGPGGGRPLPLYFDAFREAPVDHPVRRAMAADARVYLPDDILAKVDRASMSVALEARVPILDHRVVRFALGLPLQQVWHGGRTKAPLRAVLDRHVPRELIERPKHGFGIPIGQLLAPQLDTWSERYLAPERLREEGNLDPAGVEGLCSAIQGHPDAPVRAALRWRLICFQRWFARHHRGESLA